MLYLKDFMKKVLFVCFMIFLSGCKQEEIGDLPTVSSVDVNRYIGKWFEIASLPQVFQAGCNCTQAEYDINSDGSIKVINTCKLFAPTGPVSRITGKAVPEAGSNNAKLKVSFFGNNNPDLASNYWIIELAEDYSYAVVGDPTFSTLWILCRERTMDATQYQGIIDRMSELGFETGKVKKQNQIGCE